MDDELFQWDDGKARSNFSKHGVALEEARSAFDDPFGTEILDQRHSRAETRWHLIARSAFDRVLAVVFVERGDKIRIVSARLATRRERRIYEEG